MIELTDKAKVYLVGLCEKENQNIVMLSVKGGGCAGFSYEYNYAKEEDIEPNDIVLELPDSKKFVIDSISLLYLIGTTIDYKETLGGSFLEIINPNESSSCGCGKSFGV